MFKLFVASIISLASVFASQAQQGFRQTQQSYPRVRDAYYEKGDSMKVQLSEIQLDPEEIELYIRAFKLEKGIGSKLVQVGLEMAKASGFTSVIVLGHLTFYPRFGFVPASKWNIISPWDIPDDIFMAMELTGGALKGVSGTVEYSSEFNDAV